MKRKMKTKLWSAMVAVGTVVALSTTISASPQIWAVDAWGRGISATEQQQEVYNNGGYGGADVSALIDGITADQAYPARAQVGGSGQYDNLWMYVDLGQNYLVDQVKTYDANNHGYPWYMYVATALDGSEGTVVYEDFGELVYRTSDGLWTEDTATPPSATSAPWTIQAEQNMSAGLVGDFTFTPVLARYVKVGVPGYGYGGFALAELEVYGVIPGPVPLLPGNFNGDGIVDAADYTVWRDHLGEANEAILNGNGDGLNGIDQDDYALWKANFNNTAIGTGSGIVPEPTSVALLAIGLLIAGTHSSAIRQGRGSRGRANESRATPPSHTPLSGLQTVRR